jgi:hypothetical protein
MPAFSKLADVPARAILDGAIQGRYVHVDAMTIGEVSLTPVPLIPGGVTHGGTTLTACKVIDVFSPIREDYRQP